jgi:putative ABC transport system permease protein
MEIRPILSAMSRNKVGAILIAVQIAITLAILCNALFIIEQRVTSSKRPSGADEANVFVIGNQWVGNPPDLSARLQGDLAALRALPGVVDAYASNSFPLNDGGSTTGVSLHPDQETPTALAALYFADEHTLEGLGLKLIAGRNFTSAEIADKAGYTDFTRPPPGLIITRVLAEKLFPNANAVGQSIYDEARREKTPIIGVIDRLQVPWVQAGGWGNSFFDNSVLEPFRLVVPRYFYIVRAKPGQLVPLMQAAQKKLFEISRSRVIRKTESMVSARDEAYKDDRGLVVILSVVCVALLAVTAFGIVGLTSYWVAQRRRHIGIRRALGATRNAVIQYFQTENLLIAGVGAAIGVVLAVALNLWMVTAFEMQRLNTGYALVGAFAVLLLGQASVLWPALRAASIPPALATRAV